ncbi:MAG: TOBE domain-containing protein [Thermoplasmata archaeon]|nr:TOBE domain-containing protein [Thermoplasmata archaeon]
MSRARPLVEPSDLALLEEIVRRGTLVAAAVGAGMTRDRAIYRIRRLERAFGQPMVKARRGGSMPGSTELSPAGRSVLREGSTLLEVGEPVEAAPHLGANHLEGFYRSHPEPTIVAGSVNIAVAFAARDGERVRVAFEPDSVLLAREPFASSARNAWNGRIVRVRGAGLRTGRCVVEVEIGTARLRAAVTERSLRSLGLRPGSRVTLYVKATAVRRVPPPLTLGSLPSRARRPPRPRGGSASR